MGYYYVLNWWDLMLESKVFLVDCFINNRNVIVMIYKCLLFFENYVILW